MTARLRQTLPFFFFVVWAAFVTFVTVHHEPWRDEVRALSISIEPSHFWQLTNELPSEGHPIVWYLILRFAWSLVASPVALKIASVSIAIAAMALLFLRAPFPLWQRVLFACGTIPLYEYSVIARNYGAAMLLLFLFATLRRRVGPVGSGTILALFANVNAYGALLCPIVAAVWVSDEWHRDHDALKRDTRKWVTALLIVTIGIAFAAVVTRPVTDTPFFDSSRMTIEAVVRSIVSTLQVPGREFQKVIPLGSRWLVALLTVGLLPRIDLAGACATTFVVSGMFSDLIYASRLRHEGMLLIMIVSLYWLSAEWARDRDLEGWARKASVMGRYVGLTVLFCFQIVSPRHDPGAFPTSFHRAWADVKHPASSSRQVARLIESRPELAEAIIIADPGTYLDPLPYYIANRLYFPREGRFGTYARHGDKTSKTMSLGDLLAVARRLEQEEERPVLILLGRQGFNPDSSSTNMKMSTFVWDEVQMEQFEKSTLEIANFDGSLFREDYRVYLLQ